MVFTRAGPAEILRSSQKDDSVVQTLQGMLEELCLFAFGARTTMKNKNMIVAVGKLLYFGNTTLQGLQTLGEEYTGIVQVDSSLRDVPTFLARLIMVLLDCFGPVLTLKLVKEAEASIKSNNEVRPEAKTVLLSALSISKNLVPFWLSLHKAYFYCRGGFYQLSKRLTGVHYILARFWLKDRRSLRGFRLLGILTLLQTLLIALFKSYELWLKRALSSAPSSSTATLSSGAQLITSTVVSSRKCVMCLSSCVDPAATPCGHIFCWACIHAWSQSESQCPTCRATFQVHRLIPLLNFD